MGQHKNARLTVAQRRIVYQERQNKTSTINQLAKRFGVNPKTIVRWSKRENPEDRPSGPRQVRTVITPAYRKAVLERRAQHSDEGPISIAHHLQKQFPFANRGTVLRILQQANQTKPNGPKKIPLHST